MLRDPGLEDRHAAEGSKDSLRLKLKREGKRLKITAAVTNVIAVMLAIAVMPVTVGIAAIVDMDMGIATVIVVVAAMVVTAADVTAPAATDAAVAIAIATNLRNPFRVLRFRSKTSRKLEIQPLLFCRRMLLEPLLVRSEAQILAQSPRLAAGGKRACRKHLCLQSPT